jgi:putative effector of murein hydrolase LrgA (UPF0299 family)
MPVPALLQYCLSPYPAVLSACCFSFYCCRYKFCQRNGLSPVAHLLIRYMALLFVPVGVGVMKYYDLLSAQFGPLVVSCTVSTLVVLAAVSFLSHRVHGERSIAGQSEVKRND